MTEVRDYQRSACYTWEQEIVAPKGRALVPFCKAQAMVDWIWETEGLSYPPVVRLLSPTNRATAMANRTEVFFRENVETWVILHELAHSMTSTIEGDSVGHRAPWLGVYMQLAAKYLGIPVLVLTATAGKAGLDFDITARPIFLDR